MPAKNAKLLALDPRHEQTKQLHFNSYLNLSSLVLTIDKNVAQYHFNMYAASHGHHYMDILGSGWVNLNYETTAPGVEGFDYSSGIKDDFLNLEIFLQKILPQAYIPFSLRLMQLAFTTKPSYQPIDWCKDHKSGFRFDSRLPYNQQFNQIAGNGIDIKVPWELGRMQHLLQMAVFAKQNGLEPEAVVEYKAQLLDFMAINPCGIGVNWSCAMDIGIRAANICMAHDLFLQMDKNGLLNDEFNNLLYGYLLQHGLFIYEHFEYQEGLTSNHYLCNVAGLFFLANFLSGANEINDWLVLSLQELFHEGERQFFDEGTNFEGSTSYHRLSAETLTCTLSLLLGMKAEKMKTLFSLTGISRSSEPFFDTDYFSPLKNDLHNLWSQKKLTGKIASVFQRMQAAAQFTQDITRQNGDVTQIGDNDSGRFIKLTPIGSFISSVEAKSYYKNLAGWHIHHPQFWDENYLNHQSFVSLVNGIASNHSGPCMLEYSFSIALAGEKRPLLKEPKSAVIEKFTSGNIDFKLIDKPNYDYQLHHVFKFEPLLLEEIKYLYYPEFGMVVAKSQNLFLSLVCGSGKGFHHSWGHVHCDKLSMELQVNGKDILTDAGTYIYTPLPAQRNKFRSVQNHNTLVVESEEQNWWFDGKKGLFKMMRQAKAKLEYCDGNKIVATANYRGIKQMRIIEIKEHEITVGDYCNKPFRQNWNMGQLVSNGYGKIIN